ncbi:hypothetical protein ACLKA6_006543 [Drosophila palustris]
MDSTSINAIDAVGLAFGADGILSLGQESSTFGRLATCLIMPHGFVAVPKFVYCHQSALGFVHHAASHATAFHPAVGAIKWAWRHAP